MMMTMMTTTTTTTTTKPLDNASPREVAQTMSLQKRLIYWSMPLSLKALIWRPSPG